MSFEGLRWALDLPGLSPTERLVAVYLADHHNARSGQLNPSVGRLTERSGLSRRSVLRALQDLEQRGLVIVERRSGERSSYSLSFGGPVPTGHQCQPDTGAAESPDQCHPDTGPVSQSHQTSATVAPASEEGRNQEQTRKEEGLDCASASMLAGGHNGNGHPTSWKDPRVRDWLRETKHLSHLADDRFADLWKGLDELVEPYPFVFFNEELRNWDNYLEAKPQKRPVRHWPKAARNWFMKAIEIGQRDQARLDGIARRSNGARPR